MGEVTDVILKLSEQTVYSLRLTSATNKHCGRQVRPTWYAPARL